MISLITTYAPIVLETSKTPEKDSINRNVSPKHENIIKAVEKINSLKDGRSRTFGSFASFAAGVREFLYEFEFLSNFKYVLLHSKFSKRRPEVIKNALYLAKKTLVCLI